MLEVTFSRDSRNRLSSIFAGGHAGFAEYGEDIVCAAVSAILQAARLGLTEYAGVDLDAHQESGLLRIQLPEEAREDPGVRAILATAELAVGQIAEQFPDHISVAHVRETD